MSKEITSVGVRCVIQDGDNVLLTRMKNGNFYFLPGGGIHFYETAKQAIVREMQEELGIADVESNFIGTAENMFVDGSTRRHGIDLVFSVEVHEKKLRSKEEHINFEFKKISELAGLNILPKNLKNNLIRWFKDQKPFWAGID